MKQETWALVISGLALLASIWSVVESHRSSNRNVSLQERMLRLESGRELERRISGLKAQLVAFIVHGDGRERLYFRNQGPAAAQDIEILVDERPLKEHPLVMRPDRDLVTLGASAEASVGLLRYDGRPDRLRVALHWADESGDRGHWESDLSLH
jgi:hypothetical protein